MNHMIISYIILLTLCTQASSENILFNDSSWNHVFTLQITASTQRYLVGGRLYTGDLIQNTDSFVEVITVRDGALIRDSSVYFINRKSNDRYCTEVESVTDTMLTDMITYNGATYTDERNPQTGKGMTVYTENGKICMTVSYDNQNSYEYGKCKKQNWFDEMLE